LASTVSTPDIAAAPRLVVFRLGERSFGIHLSSVREILPFRRATRLPGAPAYVAGLINVRGTIVTVIDLGRRLGSTTAAHADAAVVLVECGAHVVGVLVDEVLDVRRPGDDDFRVFPTEGNATGALRAIAQQGESTVLMLDVEEIVREILL